MAYINYARFERVLHRAQELVTGPTAQAVVARVYNDVLRPRAEAYFAATKALARAEASFAKENREAHTALADIDQHYKATRSVVAAYLSHLELPDTLRSLPTDTDRLHAIEALHDEVEAHHDQPWSADLLAGPFGTQAPTVVRELHEAMDADTALASARTARANAYAAAYPAYLAFKRVVRESYGPTSHEYHKIHLRSTAREDAAATTTPPAAPGAPAAPTTGGSA